MFKPSTNLSRAFTILIGISLIAVALIGWIPVSCPVLRRIISTCPGPRLVYLQTPEQKILATYPHETIKTNFVEFSAKAEIKRDSTMIYFPYFLTPSSNVVALLQVEKDDGYNDIALITHPLLQNLTWPSVSNQDIRLYQRNGTFQTLDDFKQKLPSQTVLVADTTAAKAFSLTTSQFTPLEPLTNLTTADYILTTYSPPVHDKGWLLFTTRFNLSDVKITNSKINWRIVFLRGVDTMHTLPLGGIHIDYTHR